MVYSCCIRSGYIGVMLDQKSVLACGKCQASTWRVEIGGFYLARARNRIQKLKGNCLARIIFCVPHMYLNLFRSHNCTPPDGAHTPGGAAVAGMRNTARRVVGQ
jgi:hypothetical protein